MSTKHSKFYRLLSLLLVCTMLFELLPANALAANQEEAVNPADTPEAAVETIEPAEMEPIETEDQEEVPQATVLGEMEELREENVKHFRMSDGTFTAISYDQPVHYADADGQWQDIDNSLSYQAATADTAATYSTGAGSFGVSYAAELTEDLLFTTQDGAISLMWVWATKVMNWR